MFYNHCALYSVLSLDNSKFYCKVCDLGFSFKSAYERHVDSARHKMYVASFVPLENEDLQFDEDIPSMLSPSLSSNDLEVSKTQYYRYFLHVLRHCSIHNYWSISIFYCLS